MATHMITQLYEGKNSCAKLDISLADIGGHK